MTSRITGSTGRLVRAAAFTAITISGAAQANFARAADAAAPATDAAASAPTPVSAAELESLRARIAQLEAAQDRVDGAIRQSQAIDAAVRDADSRQLFAPETLTSGWENGFKIRSADGAYELQPYIETQFRYTANDTGDAKDAVVTPGIGSSDDDWQGGFEVRRLKVGLKGNAFSKDFRYNFRFNADRNTGSITPDYAYGEYQFAKDWAVRFGQFKLDWSHEWTVSDTRQLAVERSLLDQYLGGGPTQYVQGVSLLYGAKDQPLHGSVSFTDGDNSLNTNYTDQQGTAQYQDFAVAARVEYKVFGDWDSYSDFTARKDTKDLLVIGAGGDWAQGGDGDVYRMTADAQYENTGGLSAYGAAIYTIADADSVSFALDRSWGAVAQVGYLLPNLNDWEVFGRYTFVKLDGDFVAGNRDDFTEITVGANKYIVGHNAKFTVDLGYLPNGSSLGASGLGVTANPERQVIFRAQLQILL